MLKLASLRAALVAALPALNDDPSLLMVVAEAGRVVCMGSPMTGFAYEYRAVLTLLDFKDALDTAILPVLIWFAANQPEQLANVEKAHQAVRFEATLLDAQGTCDLAISLDLTENVQVSAGATGGYSLTHLPEPDWDALLDAPLDNAPNPPITVSQIRVDDDLVAPEAL